MNEQLKYLVKCAARQDYRAAVAGLLEAVDEALEVVVPTKVCQSFFRKEDGWREGMIVKCIHSSVILYEEGHCYVLTRGYGQALAIKGKGTGYTAAFVRT